MNCKDFQTSIVFFVDGELDKQNSAQFENHLESCTKCKELFEQVSLSYNFIKEDRITESNPFFYSKVKALIDHEKQTSGFSLFAPKKFSFQIAAYIIIGIFAISAGYFIANDKTYLGQESLQEQYEVTDEELFADLHYLTLSTNDLYVVKTNEIGE